MNDNIVTSVQLSSEDILTVAISRAEMLMNEKLSTALDRVQILEQEYVWTENALGRSIGASGRNRFADAIAFFESAFDAAGSRIKPEINIVSQLVTKCDAIRATLQINVNGCHSHMTFESVLPLTSEQRQMVESLDKLEADLQSSQDDVAIWRKRLEQLPTLERFYRAKLAETMLGDSFDYKMLLEALDLTNVEKHITALPVDKDLVDKDLVNKVKLTKHSIG